MGNTNLCCCQNDFSIKSELKDDDKRVSNKARQNKIQNTNKMKTETNQDVRLNNREYANFIDAEFTNNINNEETINSERRKKLRDLSESGPKLTLEVVNKVTLPLGTKIEINSTGLENFSKRLDGLVYFGCQKESNDNSEEENDFVFNLNEQDTDEERCYGRHFQIRFDSSVLKYFIKDLGKGFGAFMKISNFAFLKTDSLINIGDSYIVVYLGEDTSEDTIKENVKDDKEMIKCITDSNYSLQLKIYSGNLKIEPRIFKAEDKLIVRLGRSNDAEVCINDQMLSRYHCFIQFESEINTWILYDGYICEDEEIRKFSTNGTWLYLKDEIEIMNHMIFKANHTVFKAHLTNN